jgi:AAA+ ATPase superfamily predicted ATPase
MRLGKPKAVFDRAEEWGALAHFATHTADRGRFGVVYGRRRQGKSWLLERLAERTKGWYWEAFEGTQRQHLDAFAAGIRAAAKLPVLPRFDDWAAALEAAWSTVRHLLVIDEFQYLVQAAPELPSLLQTRVSRAGGPRVIVCGSALGPMRSLLAGDAPLRGRASLELLIRPFDYRTAAHYWHLHGAWDVAARLHALLGGTPAYRDFAAGRTPDAESFDAWVCESLLNPASALFREGRILVDEPTMQDRGLYLGILSAIASGRTRRGQIAAALGRPDNTLAHPLNALVDLALIDRVEDPLHARRSFFRLAEPLLRTYESLIAPHERAIERRGARQIWRTMQPTLDSLVYGPHFETLAREWVARHASEQTLGGTPRSIGPSVVSDPEAKREMEIDVVATEGDTVLAIGEAKWSSKPLGVGVLDRLERKRSLLGSRGERARLLVFGRVGFDRALRQRARGRHDVALVDLDRLYRGD